MIPWSGVLTFGGGVLTSRMVYCILDWCLNILEGCTDILGVMKI